MLIHQSFLKKLIQKQEYSQTTKNWITRCGILLRPWWYATLAVLPIFVLLHILLFVLTYLGIVLFTVTNFAPNALPGGALFYSWYRWDAVRFATIAANGYVSLEYTAFFPLYPWLSHFISALSGNDPYLVGIWIANLAFLGVQIVLYRLVENNFDPETAKRTVLYISIFPTSFFLCAAYNESLFLLLLLLSIYTLQRGYWWPAGFLGGLATLTRSSGLLLLFVFLYDFLYQHFANRQYYKKMLLRRNYLQLLKKLNGAFAALLIPLGLGIYAFYLTLRFHDPLAFLHAQALWRSGLTPPYIGFSQAVDNFISMPANTFVVVHTWIDLCVFLFFLVLLMLCFFGSERLPRKMWALAILGLLMLFFPLLYPGLYGLPLASTERFVLEIIAGFILLARLGRRLWWHQWYLILTLPLLSFLLIQFVTNHWTV